MFWTIGKITITVNYCLPSLPNSYSPQTGTLDQTKLFDFIGKNLALIFDLFTRKWISFPNLHDNNNNKSYHEILLKIEILFQDFKIFVFRPIYQPRRGTDSAINFGDSKFFCRHTDKKYKRSGIVRNLSQKLSNFEETTRKKWTVNPGCIKLEKLILDNTL